MLFETYVEENIKSDVSETIIKRLLARKPARGVPHGCGLRRARAPAALSGGFLVLFGRSKSTRKPISIGLSDEDLTISKVILILNWMNRQLNAAPELNNIAVSIWQNIKNFYRIKP